MSGVSASSGCERRVFEETRDASPANLLIKIESFSLLSKYGIDKYESRTFEAGDYKWKMIIYPDGYNGENDYVSVYFSIADTDTLPVGWEFNAIFAFFVHNQLMDNYLCFRGTTLRFNAVISKWGFSKTISKKSLIDPSKGYVVDDSIVFGAEVFVIKSERVNECLSLLKETAPSTRDWKISDFSKLGNVWNSEEFVVGNYNWKVELYPKGESSQPKDRYMSLFLECVSAEDFAPHQKVKAEVLVRIKNKLDGTNHYENYNGWYTSSTKAWGIPECIELADSRCLFFDDCCILEIQITVQAHVLDAPKV